MSDALDRYLARPDADERVKVAIHCATCQPCVTCAAEMRCTPTEYTEVLDGYRALASALEEVEGMLMESICADMCGRGYSAPGYCPDHPNPSCTAIINRLADLRARYREEMCRDRHAEPERRAGNTRPVASDDQSVRLHVRREEASMKVPQDFPHLWDHKEKRRVADYFAAHELIDLREWCPARARALCTLSLDQGACTLPCPVLSARKETT